MRPNWSTVMEQHGRWLRTVVLARTGEAQAIEEVLQEVAMAAVKSANRPADPSKLAPWLYRLAVRQSLLYRRRLGRQRRLHGRYAERQPAGDIDDRALDPLIWLLADERRQLIRTALGRLAARDKEILLLKYTESWSYVQLSQHLGIRAGAVESRLHRARARLRDELAALNVIEATS